MKFLIFGTGDYYNRYKIWFDRKDIAALIDNSKEKQGHYIDGTIVIPPENIGRYEYDAVVILSFYFKAMKSQLMELGIEENKIYHFFDLHSLRNHLTVKKKIRCYGLKNGDEEDMRDRGGKKILLLSHDLTLGGPAIALYHAAQTLVKKGRQVVFGAMWDGPLQRILTREGIPVIVDENLMVATMDESQWVKEYSLVICNTMNFHVFLSERDEKIPVAWWLHDAFFFYGGVRREVMDKLSQDNMKIWSVGPIPRSAVETFRPDFHVDDLIYGVADQAGERNKQKEAQNTELRFITIGYIEYRKGQDILLKAIRSLKPNVRRRAKFLFVGQNTSLMAKELMEASEEIPEITVTGLVNRKELYRLLRQSDVLICPSRVDPMPTVAAEAMMCAVPCLISDAAGTVKYLRHGIDGMIFQSGKVRQLKALLESCIQGGFDLEKMGGNARRVYEKFFSMDVFENRFMGLMERIDF